MNDNIEKCFLGLGLHPEYFSLVSARSNQIDSIAMQELSQFFDVKYLRDGNWTLNYYIEVLSGLCEKIGEKGKQVGVALNSSMVLIKKVPIAMGLEEELIQDQMSWEAEQMLISPFEQYNMVYERLPFSASTGNPILLQVLIRKKLIETVQKMVSEAGLQLLDIDVDYFSIIRTIANNYSLDPKGIDVLMDLHKEYVGLVFIQKQEYFLSHRIVLHQDTESATEVTKMVLKDLRRILFGHGLGKGVEDINHFFILDHISRKDIIQEFIESVRVPVTTIHPFQKISCVSSISKSNEYSFFPERFTSSVGMILKKFPGIVK